MGINKFTESKFTTTPFTGSSEVIIKIYFQYRIKGTIDWIETSKQEVEESGFYDLLVEELDENTTYEYRAIVEVDGVIQDTGEIVEFTTDSGGIEVNVNDTCTMSLTEITYIEVEVVSDDALDINILDDIQNIVYSKDIQSFDTLATTLSESSILEAVASGLDPPVVTVEEDFVLDVEINSNDSFDVFITESSSIEIFSDAHEVNVNDILNMSLDILEFLDVEVDCDDSVSIQIVEDYILENDLLKNDALYISVDECFSVDKEISSSDDFDINIVENTMLESNIDVAEVLSINIISDQIELQIEIINNDASNVSITDISLSDILIEPSDFINVDTHEQFVLDVETDDDDILDVSTLDRESVGIPFVHTVCLQGEVILEIEIEGKQILETNLEGDIIRCP